jgi:hypothetical protein
MITKDPISAFPVFYLQLSECSYAENAAHYWRHNDPSACHDGDGEFLGKQGLLSMGSELALQRFQVVLSFGAQRFLWSKRI